MDIVTFVNILVGSLFGLGFLLVIIGISADRYMAYQAKKQKKDTPDNTEKLPLRGVIPYDIEWHEPDLV